MVDEIVGILDEGFSDGFNVGPLEGMHEGLIDG
jgi:hypothetical protein